MTLTPCKKGAYSRVREDYTPLHVYLGCIWVVIYVNYITFEGLSNGGDNLLFGSATIR